ncbi:MAG TPA: SDR family oxidoreductase [bacterium]|nr:SDR family oxidoreductase [bacterium]
MNLFITGGSRGIGRATVLAAARKGHDVAFTYCTNESAAAQVLEEARRSFGDRKVKSYRLDIKDSNQVESVFGSVLRDFGHVDAVVCNAGILKDGLLFSLSDEDWREVIDTNLTGNFFVARQFLQEFIARKTGRFVFLSSIIRNGGTGQANYAASKAGLVGLSGTIAKEYGPKGICSNVVVPGFFETEMTFEAMSEKLKSFWLQYCPLKRVGRTDELTELILFLASENNGFINGQVVSATGGLDWSY